VAFPFFDNLYPELRLTGFTSKNRLAMLFRKSTSNIGWKSFRKKPVAEKKPEAGEKNMFHNVLKMRIPKKYCRPEAVTWFSSQGEKWNCVPSADTPKSCLNRILIWRKLVLSPTACGDI
jgi:hypothetical protein